MGKSITIRPADLQDAERIADVHIRSWQEGYRGIVDPVCLRSLNPEESVNLWRGNLSSGKEKIFLAFNEAAIAGFSYFLMPEASTETKEGELVALYVHPDCFRQGVGSALFHHAAREVSEAGGTQMQISVLERHAAARSFYEAMGAKLIPDSAVELTDDPSRSVEGKPLVIVRYALDFPGPCR